MLVKTYQSLKKKQRAITFSVEITEVSSCVIDKWLKIKISESRTTFQQFNDARLIWTYVKTEG